MSRPTWKTFLLLLSAFGLVFLAACAHRITQGSTEKEIRRKLDDLTTLKSRVGALEEDAKKLHVRVDSTLAELTQLRAMVGGLRAELTAMRTSSDRRTGETPGTTDQPAGDWPVPSIAEQEESVFGPQPDFVSFGELSEAERKLVGTRNALVRYGVDGKLVVFQFVRRDFVPTKRQSDVGRDLALVKNELYDSEYGFAYSEAVRNTGNVRWKGEDGYDEFARMLGEREPRQWRGVEIDGRLAVVDTKGWYGTKPVKQLVERERDLEAMLGPVGYKFWSFTYETE